VVSFERELLGVQGVAHRRVACSHVERRIVAAQYLFDFVDGDPAHILRGERLAESLVDHLLEGVELLVGLVLLDERPISTTSSSSVRRQSASPRKSNPCLLSFYKLDARRV